MFNFFNAESFSQPFASMPSFDANSVRQSSYDQGMKMLEMQRKMVDAQMKQAEAMTEMSRKQMDAMVRLQAESFQQGVTAMMDAQAAALAWMKPVSA